MTIIAHAHNGFSDKFGIPRQSREDSQIETRIVFTPPFRNPDAIRGIETYSHLWLIWQFNETSTNLTVRPPRLGGNKRVGVFATRSPFRPNAIGLSCVKLAGVEKTAQGTVLKVAGADLVNGTPIYDIKPYIPYTDCRPEATGGFTDEVEKRTVEVRFEETARKKLTEKEQTELAAVLKEDPRPAYQEDPERVYGMSFAGLEIRFRVENRRLLVVAADR